MRLFEQIGLFAGNTREQRLKLEPSREMASDLFPGRQAQWHDRSSPAAPAASASNCAWQLRSMVMNHHAASSTHWPTVINP